MPTITPVGIAALSAESGRRRVNHGGAWRLEVADTGHLTQKKGREAWLARELDEVRFCNLSHLPKPPVDRIPEDTFIIVSDTPLDAVRETASPIACNLFSGLPRLPRRGIHRLFDRVSSRSTS